MWLCDHPETVSGYVTSKLCKLPVHGMYDNTEDNIYVLLLYSTVTCPSLACLNTCKCDGLDFPVNYLRCVMLSLLIHSSLLTA